ncbi:MAG: hypothetical protein WCP61_07960 [Chitinophagia bacterium]
MAKQSPKDPKFRCNICKEYYYAPEYKVHYQCPKHGYLCQKHIGIKDHLIYGHEKNNPNVERSTKKSFKNDPYFDKVIKLPNEYIGNCLCSEVDNSMQEINFVEYDFWDSSIELSFNGTYSGDKRCKKKPAKFVWNEKVKRWMEEGEEKVEDYIKDQKVKSSQKKSNNSEINLLLDLFEKNVLTKVQFLEQIKGKL